MGKEQVLFSLADDPEYDDPKSRLVFDAPKVKAQTTIGDSPVELSRDMSNKKTEAKISRDFGPFELTGKVGRQNKENTASLRADSDRAFIEASKNPDNRALSAGYSGGKFNANFQRDFPNDGRRPSNSLNLGYKTTFADGGSIPQGIASLGRGQDSMLVHMTPGEVQGLQRLAMAHGGSLTINPQTGLPEAGFLSSLLPMIAGIGLNLAFPGSGALIGAGVGGLTALATGSLGKGLKYGLGAYSGAELGAGLSSMGTAQAQGLVGAETNAASDLVGKQAYENTLKDEAARQATAIENAAGSSSQTYYPPKITNAAFDESGAAWGGRTPTTYTEPGYWGEVTQTPPPTFSQTPAQLATAARQQAMNTAAETFTPPADSAAGQALARGSTGNMVAGVKQLGTKEGLKTLGGKLGYAGMAGLAAPLISSAMQPNKFAPPARTPTQYYKADYKPPKFNELTGTYDPASYGQGSYYTDPTQYAAEGGAVGFKQGGIADFYPLTGDPVSTGPSPGGLGNPGKKRQYSVDVNSDEDVEWSQKGPNNNNKGIYENTPSDVETLFDKASAATLARYIADGKSAPRMAAAKKKFYELTNAYNKNYGDTTSAAQGGLMGLNTYAAGGKLLRGPGDGMSDSIPAVINGAKPQRAALADGEFVIPADVVSHLGNGSTEAGSRQLYSMMNKVRKARTGNPKQGKQINPERFIPA